MGTVCVVSHAAVHAALLCRCLGLSIEDMGKFRMSTAGVTVIEFPYEEDTGIVRCDSEPSVVAAAVSASSFSRLRRQVPSCCKLRQGVVVLGSVVQRAGAAKART